MLKKIFTMEFGKITVKEIFKTVFILGLIGIIIQSIIGIFIANNVISKWLSHFASKGTIIEPGLILSAPFSIIISLVFIILWKITCELLYLIFCTLETYIKKNQL